MKGSNESLHNGRSPAAHEPPPKTKLRVALTSSLAAIIPPLIMCGIQWLFWSTFRPFAWFLFLPTILISAWVGGLWSGLGAAALSTTLVWWAFLPQEHSFHLEEPNHLIVAAVFIATGIAIASFIEQLRKAQRATSSALLALQQKNEKLEQAIKERQIFGALIENSSDFIGIADPDGKPVYVNPAGRRMVGLAEDHPIETTQIADYYPPEERDFVRDVIVQSMVERGHWQGETSFRHWQTGRAIPVSDTHFMIRQQEAGPILGMGTVTRDISDVRRAFDLVKEAEARFRALVDASAQIVWTTDADGTIVEDSPSWRAFTGQTYEQWKETRGRNLLHPEDRDRVATLWESVRKTRTPLDTEYRIRHVSGEWRWAAVRAVPILRPDASVKEWVGMITDITARKQAQEALRASEAKFSGIIAVSADAIISVDEQQRITVFNEGAQRIFGWSKAEALGAPLDVLLPERYRDLHRRDVQTFADGPVVARQLGERSNELVGVRKNGQEFPAEAGISKLQVGGSRVLTVALRDITDRKRLEGQQRFLADVGAVLASATLDIDATLTSIARLVIRDLADCCIVDIVDEAQSYRVAVLHRDPAKASVCRELEAIRPESRALIWGAVQSQRPQLIHEVTDEFLRTTAYNAEHLRMLRAVEVRSLLVLPLLSHGRLLGTLLLISSRPQRLYEEGDVPFAQELAHRAALAIENANLYQTAVREARSRELMNAVVSHDLKNPLSSIRMRAELMAQGRADPQNAQRIKQTADRMLRLIKSLLDAATIESGKLTIRREPISMRALVQDALADFDDVAREKSLRLEQHVPEEDFAISCDRDRLQQALSNLLGNALKFTERGSVSLRIERVGNEALFTVEDTGHGIAAAQVPHVFDRYWQADPTAGLGSGLGLSIVKGIVEAHGGRIWVDSELGVGTAFRFTVPLAGHAGEHAALSPA